MDDRYYFNKSEKQMLPFPQSEYDTADTDYDQADTEIS